MLPDNPQPLNTLRGLLINLYHWRVEHNDRVFRLAARMAVKEPVQYVTPEQLKEVAEVGAAGPSIDVIDLRSRHWKWVQTYHGKNALKEILQEDEKELGIPSYAERMWDVTVDFVINAAKRILPSLGTQPDYYDYMLAEYCRGALDPDEQFMQAMQLLEKTQFADELLHELRRKCPQEYKAKNWPVAPNRLPLTDGQLRLWNALNGRALIGKHLAQELSTSHEVVRQWVMEMKIAGFEIANKSGRGYFRPDAPPAA